MLLNAGKVWLHSLCGRRQHRKLFGTSRPAGVVATVVASAGWLFIDEDGERFQALGGRGWLVLAAHVHAVIAWVVLVATATDQDDWRLPGYVLDAFDTHM